MVSISKKRIIVIICVIVFIIICAYCISNGNSSFKHNSEKTFNLLSSLDNKEFENELMNYAESEGYWLDITYEDDLEAINTLNGDTTYDGVWMSNSVWLYMLENNSVSNSKSININPVVFGIKKSKANELGFVDKDIYNKDIVNKIKEGKLKYVMSSVTKTNTGLISYFGFLNSLSGSPEILTSEMINKKSLRTDLTALFSGVERVSGSDDFLQKMFLNSDEYESVVATESSLIEINKQLVSNGKEPLYLVYPVDGVAINDSPFAYLDHGQEKIDCFNKLQTFLLNKDSQTKLEALGKRTWYGGVKDNANASSFKTEWGIDTTKYLIPLKYPSKEVINEAINLYVDYFRKPSSTVFCLDYSGSMYGGGEQELESAMNFILDYKEASKDNIQFSENDKITVIPFNDTIMTKLTSENGKNTNDLIQSINDLGPNGGTNIYKCSVEALKILNDDNDKYTKTVILMTDGNSNTGSYYDLSNYYTNSEKIPVYSIMFGSSSEYQLNEIANLTNAKIFDGRTNLVKAFKEVRSYN